MVIHFFGTKTDSSRTGNEIIIKKGTDGIVDPVKCVRDYMDRTHSVVTGGDQSPVFVTLRAPHSALSASGVANILNECIAEAGLSGSGFSARSFRPTGATAYVSSGVENHITRSLGRWKSEECFNSNYVYPLSAVSATDKMLDAQLPSNL